MKLIMKHIEYIGITINNIFYDALHPDTQVTSKTKHTYNLNGFRKLYNIWYLFSITNYYS